jgi:tRNA dimethylallyltransferase
MDAARPGKDVRQSLMARNLWVIVGPTASGKTDLSLWLAKHYGGEIVSADSMQLYRYMDIGTAKPTPEERAAIPHHLVDCIDPGEPFNVALYQAMARQAIEDILGRDRQPILVGGTGLYVNSVVYPLTFTEAGEDSLFRDEMWAYVREKGEQALYKKLEEADPEAAKRLHPHDVKRVIRALEIVHLSGTSGGDYRKAISGPPLYDARMVGLTMDRNRLYQRINLRVDRMIEAGLVEEVRGLLAQGCTPDMISMQGLGYKEIISYLNGECSLEEAADTIKQRTRRFAKRQYTWFRRDPHIRWFDIDATGVETTYRKISDWLTGNHYCDRG